MSELISGKEALIALANGEDVEYWCENAPSIQKKWTTIKTFNEYRLSYFLEDKPCFEFRLKPRTITINNIEVPAPFEPKGGDDFRIYVIDTRKPCGFDWQHSTHYKLGSLAWRSADEIKQVVAALKKIFVINNQ